METLRTLLVHAVFAGMAASGLFAQKGTLVVLNKSEATASLIALETGKVVKTLPTGIGPHEGVCSPDGKTVVVANYGRRGEPGSTLTVIRLPEGQVVRTIDLGEYRRPHGLVFLPDGKRVLVTVEANKAVVLVNVESVNIEAAMETNQTTSHMVAYAPGKQLAFVANIGSGTVTVIDISKKAKIKDIATGAGAEGIDVSPDEKEVWVTNRSDGTVSIIDIDSLAVIKTLKAGDFPIRAKFTPDGRYVLVSNARSAEVWVYDTRKREAVKRIAMKFTPAEEKEGRLFGVDFSRGPVPIGILIPPDGRRAYVANTNADLVSVIDLKTWKIVDRLPTGKEPDGMAYSPLSIMQTTEK